MYKKILVPVDGSEACDKLMDYVKSFGEVYHAKVILLNVYGLPTLTEYNNYPSYPLENAYSIEKQSEEMLKQLRGNIGTVPFEIELMCDAGNPAGVILDTADKTECDLILMCTHGMGAMKRFLLGSVTNKVVHHAKVPVLVIR
jgi:nucleotide-binding universal stress UspA family protein